MDLLYDYVDRDTLVKYIRLAACVSFYLILRKYYSSWIEKKQIQRQMEKDKKDKEEEPMRKEQMKTQKKESLEKEAKSFGWGKKTRKTVKNQEIKLEELADDLQLGREAGFNANEDRDIENLLTED